MKTLELTTTLDGKFSVGGEATRCGYSDRHAGYVYQVLNGGRTVMCRDAKATLLNRAGSKARDALKFSPGGFFGHTSGKQRWKIERDNGGSPARYSLRKDGTWMEVGSKNGSRLVPGHSHHYDFNF